MDKWQLEFNPFKRLPPHDISDIAKVFTGRLTELARISDLTEQPDGVFLVGMFGIGKSIFIQEYLRRIAETGRLGVYAKYGAAGFYKSVLRELAKKLSEKDINLVYETLAHDSGVKHPTVQDVRIAVQSQDTPEWAIQDLLTSFPLDQVPIIAIDDLENHVEVASISNIIQQARQLIEFGCATILVGHPIGITSGFSSSVDILRPLPLDAMPSTDLVTMMSRYLALARTDPEASHGTYPFSEGCAQILAKAMSEFSLSPRIFNFACSLLLDQAALQGLDEIDESYLAKHWNSVAKDFLARTLRDDDKRHLKIIYDNGGFISEDAHDTIAKIDGDFAEYAIVRESFSNMFRQDILIESYSDERRLHTIKINRILSPDFEFFI